MERDRSELDTLMAQILILARLDHLPRVGEVNFFSWSKKLLLTETWHRRLANR
jgi:hypothetical protein